MIKEAVGQLVPAPAPVAPAATPVVPSAMQAAGGAEPVREEIESTAAAQAAGTEAEAALLRLQARETGAAELLPGEAEWLQARIEQNALLILQEHEADVVAELLPGEAECLQARNNQGAAPLPALDAAAAAPAPTLAAPAHAPMVRQGLPTVSMLGMAAAQPRQVNTLAGVSRTRTIIDVFLRRSRSGEVQEEIEGAGEGESAAEAARQLAEADRVELARLHAEELEAMRVGKAALAAAAAAGRAAEEEAALAARQSQLDRELAELRAAEAARVGWWDGRRGDAHTEEIAATVERERQRQRKSSARLAQTNVLLAEYIQAVGGGAGAGLSTRKLQVEAGVLSKDVLGAIGGAGGGRVLAKRTASGTNMVSMRDKMAAVRARQAEKASSAAAASAGDGAAGPKRGLKAVKFATVSEARRPWPPRQPKPRTGFQGAAGWKVSSTRRVNPRVVEADKHWAGPIKRRGAERLEHERERAARWESAEVKAWLHQKESGSGSWKGRDRQKKLRESMETETFLLSLEHKAATRRNPHLQQDTQSFGGSQGGSDYCSATPDSYFSPKKDAGDAFEELPPVRKGRFVQAPAALPVEPVAASGPRWARRGSINAQDVDSLLFGA